jgi:hypothetical protein
MILEAKEILEMQAGITSNGDDSVSQQQTLINLDIFLSLLSLMQVVSSNPAHDKVYFIQHYVIKFVSGFLWALRFLHQ